MSRISLTLSRFLTFQPHVLPHRAIRISQLHFTCLAVFVVLCAGISRPAFAQFGEQRIISVEAEGATKVYAADMDNDGDQDAVSTSLLDNKIAWYENLNGAGDFGPQRIISVDALKAYALHVSDIDGDGDQDVVSASLDDNKIAWYQNLGGGSFGPQRIISTNALVAQSVYTADLDGDGDLDVLSASRDDNKIAWYENTNGIGDFGSEQVVSTNAVWANRVIAKDLDGDGDQDIISTSEQDDKVAWYRNIDGAGTFSSEIVVSLNADAVRDVQAVDLDGDADLDLLSASSRDDKIAWYENTDGLGAFGGEQIISTQADFAQAVYAADIDLDGDLDVISASINDSTLAWYENTNGLGNFGGQRIITNLENGAVAVVAANIDGDEDLDILTASTFGNRIAWYESFAGKGRVQFGSVNFIGGFAETQSAQAVFGADIDGDGDKDVLSASYNDSKIAWYPNNDGRIGQQRVISLNAAGARDVFAADIDGDGDQDVLSASGGDKAIRWYENFDGAGSFDLIHDISLNANNAYAVYAADIDNDGDLDVLSASSSDDKIAWYENLDGDGTFGEEITITKAAKGATDVLAVDVDGDGDLDVVSSSTFDDKIAWYENTDGLGVFGVQQVITVDADLAIAVHAADLDQDGDMDILSASSGDNKIAWYKNLDGQGTFSAQTIISTQADRAFAVYTADLDSDGDLDVISGSRDDNKIAWYENLDGSLFGAQQIISTNATGVRSVTTFDVDQDGDQDVLAAAQDANLIAWYENLSFISNVLSSEGPEETTRHFTLGQVYPNPFTSNANIALSVAQTQHVRIVVYDVQGRLIEVLHNGLLAQQQTHTIAFQSVSLPAGLYIMMFEGEFFSAARKMVYVR
ncbi:MAG: FG-GAP-like repeat-containing protein [Rhodothermales bacterium]